MVFRSVDGSHTLTLPEVAAVPAPPRGSEAAVPQPPLPAVIGGFKVHPLASRFPLIVGKEFDDLVESIRHARTVTPVELHGGLLIDGRNRVRAVEELRRQGVEVAMPTVEWRPVGNETVEEHIYASNVHRRHLTDDQRAALGTVFLPMIRERRRERQAATQFGAAGRPPAAHVSAPPAERSDAARRPSREKDEASTVGQFAAMCKIGLHKARQAVALAEGVEDGEINNVEIVAVAAGAKRLRDVVPAKRSPGSRKTAKKESARPEADLIFEVSPVEVDEPAPTEPEVRDRWERLKRSFAIADHRELRRLLKQIIVEEQRQFDQ